MKDLPHKNLTILKFYEITPIKRIDKRIRIKKGPGGGEIP